MTATYGNIQAPSLRVEVNNGEIDFHRLIGTVNAHLGERRPVLIWSLRDHYGDLIYQSSEYTVNDDGCTATFSHTFPEMENGQTYTIKQDVVIT